MRQRRQEPPQAMTFDEASMERSKSFVKALQELKNLRPQLYSAADYCERSYLHNQQKQMVLDNLKDYTVHALVNAVDHLGTVAYKLTDLFEQQVLDVSTVEFRISCLNQQVLTCQSYMDKEGLSQQQMFAPTPKHHKHYILPIAKVDSVGPKAHRTRLSPIADKQNCIQAKPRPHPPGTPASRTLSWYLASETNSAPDGSPKASTSNGDYVASKITREAFHLPDANETANVKPLSTRLQSTIEAKALQTFGQRGTLELPKPLSAYRSFENSGLQLYRSDRSKSMLSALFAKTKSSKARKAYAQ